MAVKVKSTVYSGEVLEQLLVRATTGNEIVDGGHIHVHPNVTKKFTLPRLKTGKMLRKRVEQPEDKHSKGDFNYDEKYLEPKEFMAFTTFNPRVFEEIWRPFQPTGNLVFSELPAEVQNQLLAELAKVVDFELGGHYINGEYAEGDDDDKLFDGILNRIVKDADVIKVDKVVSVVKKDDGTLETKDVTGKITEANILPTLRAGKQKVPKAIRKHANLKIFMSCEDFEIYDEVLTNKPFKGVDYSSMTADRYKGVQIVSLADWPKDVIVWAVTSSGIDSNFWAGVSLSDDDDVIQIDKLTNAGEKYFFKMLMKADTNTVFGEDIVLFDARDDEELPEG
ncbi:hypothetical protein [Parabacteroides sp. PF5-9]|uniref:hypothetical protein n=1 Tax=Parabacteroides sp. PF5-9 TaxID=1742404 RepID=UPI00247508F2|nr:hypothetical protein [Parabacteroides sp. PF5-9]MDH6357237.1 hypothetical protein [Parabacteroides sp. PF5-9]